MIVYKLTDAEGYCRRGLPGETLYQVGETYTSDGCGKLCTEHWRHAYEHPVLAVLHDPLHGNYGITSRMWKCDTMDGVIKRDGQLKLGTTKLKVLREVKKPEVTLEQRIAYAISCSLRLYAEESYVVWAENWLSRKDRSRESAYVADNAPQYAARFAVWAAMEEDATSAASAAMWAVNFDITLDLLSCAREVYLVD